MRKLFPDTLQDFNFQILKCWAIYMFVNMFDILRYLPCPWGVVALRGIQNQGFDLCDVGNLLIKIYL